MIFTKSESLELKLNKDFEIDYKLVERLFNQFYPDFDFVTELEISEYSDESIVLHGNYTNLKEPFNTEFKNLIKESWGQEWNTVDFCTIEFEKTATEWKPYEYNRIFNLKLNKYEFIEMVSKSNNNTGFINLDKKYLNDLNYSDIVKCINSSINEIKISRQLCDDEQIMELHSVSEKLIEEKELIEEKILNHKTKVANTVNKLINMLNDFE